MKIFRRLTLTHWLLIATFFNGIIFAAITPMWHGPDEQAHFAQVQYYAEYKHQFVNANIYNTTSKEVLESEQLLGTLRDSFGRNKFTHNPGFRIQYTNSTIGKFETQINNLPLLSRKILVKKEATEYPPLFYVLSSFFYYLAYTQSLITRVFVSRLASVIMGVATVWLGLQTAKLIFPRKKLLAFTVAAFISFHPMLSFLFSSVNSDNLMNLIFSLLIYLGVKAIVNQKFKFRDTVILIATIFAGLITKPHFVIAFPLVILLPFFFWKRFKLQVKANKKLAWLLVGGLATLIGYRFSGVIQVAIRGGSIALSDIKLDHLKNPLKNVSLVEHTIWTLRHTIAETIPWYWGVFNWLGVVLPRLVNRIVNRVMILAAAGLGLWLWRNRRLKKWKPTQKAVGFLGLSSGIFFVILMLWDWMFIRGHGFSFGMQGRYYFPTIVAHMLLLILGLSSLVSTRQKRLYAWWVKFWGIAMIVLNFIGLHTLASAYYQLSPITTFINQVSQYKPSYFKFPWILVWVTLYLISLVGFLVKYLSYANTKSHRP